MSRYWKSSGIRQLIEWREICQRVQLFIEHISIGPNMVSFLATIVSSVVHVVNLKSEIYKQLV